MGVLWILNVVFMENFRREGILWLLNVSVLLGNFRRERGYYGYEADEMTKNAKSKVKAGTNVLNQARKSQSLSVSFYRSFEA